MKKKINKYIKKPKKKFWYLNTGMVDGEKYYLWETQKHLVIYKEN